jgi:hypothetical protein
MHKSMKVLHVDNIFFKNHQYLHEYDTHVCEYILHVNNMSFNLKQ